VAGELCEHLPVLDPSRPRLLEELWRDLLPLLLWLLILLAARGADEDPAASRMTMSVLHRTGGG
jgi:hypothetical protein